MFWIFLLTLALGTIVFKLGTYSVLISLFTMFSKVVFFLVLGFIAIMIWRKFRLR